MGMGQVKVLFASTEPWIIGQAENRVFSACSSDIWYTHIHAWRERETVRLWGWGVWLGGWAGTTVGLPPMSDTALRRLYSKWLTISCVLWMMVGLALTLLGLSSAFDAIERHVFSSGFRSTRVQDQPRFLWCPTKSHFVVLFSSFFTLHLSSLWLQLILSPTSLLVMTHCYFNPVFLIRYRCLDYAVMQWCISEVRTWMT